MKTTLGSVMLLPVLILSASGQEATEEGREARAISPDIAGKVEKLEKAAAELREADAELREAGINIISGDGGVIIPIPTTEGPAARRFEADARRAFISAQPGDTFLVPGHQGASGSPAASADLLTRLALQAAEIERLKSDLRQLADQKESLVGQLAVARSRIDQLLEILGRVPAGSTSTSESDE